MARSILHMILDRQTPNIMRGLFYLILMCIVVLALDVLLLQYSRSSRNASLFSYDNEVHRIGRPDSDIDRSRHLMQPMRHKFNVGPLPSVAVPINRDFYSSPNMTCRRGYARKQLENVLGDKFDPHIPLFVDKEFFLRQNAVNMPIPFGFRDMEQPVQSILKKMPDTGIPENVPHKSCLRCVIQGNGGLALRSRLGNVINNFDIVFRLNSAPVMSYEKDVGNKTTFRMAYPESAFRRPEQYEPGWIFVVMIFKPLDLTWLETIIRGRQMNSGEGFWKKIPLSVPKPPKDFRILNPEILQETATMMGFNITSGKANKNIPTSGMLALMMAIRLCDEVAVAGFGYDPKRPSSALHYYDSVAMREIWKSWTHDISHETGILRLMKQQDVFTDLNGGIR